MFALHPSFQGQPIEIPHQVPSRNPAPNTLEINEAFCTGAISAESELCDPWDRALSSPFFASWIGRCVIVTWSVVGAALFGFATGAVLGAVAGGCSSPLFGDPSMLGEDVLAMALVGALAGAVIGVRGSDPLSAANSAPEPLAR